MRDRLDDVPRSALLALAVVVLVVGVALPVSPPGQEPAQVAEEGTVVGRPALSLAVPDNRVGAGERVSLGVVVANGGDLDRGGPVAFEERVTTARNVELRIVEGELEPPLSRSLAIETGTVLAGNVPVGVSGPFIFEVVLAPDLPPGRYTVPVEVSYEFTNIVEYSDVADPEYRDLPRQTVEDVELVVEERASIEVSLGDDRTLSQFLDSVDVVVTNTGTAPATDVGLRLRTEGGVLYFGEATRHRDAGIFLDRLDPGESRTVTVHLSAWNRVNPATYLLTANVTYRTSAGVDRTAGPFRLGVELNATR